jgi:hypothetical protein
MVGVDEVDEVDEVDKVDEVDEVDKVDKVDKVDEVDEVNEVDEVDKVDGTFRDGTAKVSRKRVVRVIDADLCCGINCRSFEGLPIPKGTAKVS